MGAPVQIHNLGESCNRRPLLPRLEAHARLRTLNEHEHKMTRAQRFISGNAGCRTGQFAESTQRKVNHIDENKNAHILAVALLPEMFYLISDDIWDIVIL